MKIFILEDSKERIEVFKKLFNHHELYIYDDVNKAIEFLKITSVDLLFLDHDLGGKHFVDSNEENTGYQLVKYLITNPNYKNVQIYIHSLNLVGAKNMYLLLRKKKYRVDLAPFNLVIKYLAIQ